MTEWATFIPLVAVVVGTLLSALMGMTLSSFTHTLGFLRSV